MFHALEKKLTGARERATDSSWSPSCQDLFAALELQVQGRTSLCIGVYSMPPGVVCLAVLLCLAVCLAAPLCLAVCLAPLLCLAVCFAPLL